MRKRMVRPAGFEPASKAWKAFILTRLDYGRSRRESIVWGYDLRVLIKWTKLGGSVEGLHHCVLVFSHLPFSNRSVEGCDPLGLYQVSHVSSISPLSVIAEDENDRNKPHNSNHPKQRDHQWIKRTGSSTCTSGRRGIGW